MYWMCIRLEYFICLRTWGLSKYGRWARCLHSLYGMAFFTVILHFVCCCSHSSAQLQLNCRILNSQKWWTTRRSKRNKGLPLYNTPYGYEMGCGKIPSTNFVMRCKCLKKTYDHEPETQKRPQKTSSSYPIFWFYTTNNFKITQVTNINRKGKTTDRWCWVRCTSVKSSSLYTH